MTATVNKQQPTNISQANIDLVVGYSRQYKKDSIAYVICHIIIKYMLNDCNWKHIGKGIKYENADERHIISFSTRLSSAFGSNEVIFDDALPMIHEWKMKFIKLPTEYSSLSFGIASNVQFLNSDFSVRFKNSSYYNTKDYYNYGYGYRNGKRAYTFAFERSKDIGKKHTFVVGDVLAMILDTGKKQLRFVLNETEISMVPDIYFDNEIKYKIAVDNYYCRNEVKIALLSYDMRNPNKELK